MGRAERKDCDSAFSSWMEVPHSSESGSRPADVRAPQLDATTLKPPTLLVREAALGLPDVRRGVPSVRAAEADPGGPLASPGGANPTKADLGLTLGSGAYRGLGESEEDLRL